MYEIIFNMCVTWRKQNDSKPQKVSLWFFIRKYFDFHIWKRDRFIVRVLVARCNRNLVCLQSLQCKPKMCYANYGMRRARTTLRKHETASLTGKFALLKLFYWKQFVIKSQHKISIFPFSFFRQSNQSGSFALISVCQDENFHRILPCWRFDILKFCIQAIT